MVTVKTAAKLNLLLNITGVRDDGYHTLETVMQTVDLYDFMTIDATGGQIRLTGNLPYIPYNEKNLVYRAAAAFFEATGIPPAARIHLTKHIPVQAGMGGGSGNAAGALIGLNRLYGEPLSRGALAALAGPLGRGRALFLSWRNGAVRRHGRRAYPFATNAGLCDCRAERPAGSVHFGRLCEIRRRPRPACGRREASARRD